MMLNLIVAVSVVACAGALNIKLNENDKRMDENIKMETHKVITSDLYILTVFRLKNLKTNIRRNQNSVLMFHGLMQSSDRFIEHGRNLSLAYDLVDAGFDVWLGNSRGNKYSRHHFYLNPDDPEDKFKFFNFTYEDIGVNDVAATVDYILNETKSIKLHYIGHSQGGTVFFALNSLRPKYNEKFLTANLLAGAGYQKHFSNSLLEMLSSIADKIYAFLLKVGYVEVFPSKAGFLLSSSYTIKDLVKHCLNSINFQNLCEMLHYSKVLGTHGINSSWFAGGGAVKEIVLFGQNVRQKRFCRWDYGKRNTEVYGTTTPPNYDLGLITVNTTLHFGMGDTLVNYKDVAEMANDMPNVRTRKVARLDFGHSDFIDGFDTKELVYDYIIEALVHFERDIKPDIVEKKSPLKLSIISASNLFIKNNSNSFVSVKSDSPITVISSFTTKSPKPSDGEINISRSPARNFSNFLNVNFSNLFPRNVSSLINTVDFDSTTTKISKLSQPNVSYPLSTNSLDESNTDFLEPLTTKISNSSHENDSGLIISNLDSITSNGPNSSKEILQSYLIANKSDRLEENDLNKLPEQRFHREKANANIAYSTLTYLPITVAATSTKNYINTTLLMAAIITLQIVYKTLNLIR